MLMFSLKFLLKMTKTSIFVLLLIAVSALTESEKSMKSQLSSGSKLKLKSDDNYDWFRVSKMLK